MFFPDESECTPLSSAVSSCAHLSTSTLVDVYVCTINQFVPEQETDHFVCPGNRSPLSGGSSIFPL
jgi:hypothetical protein